PTNHLDVDSREALVQALNGYSGAVVIVSHDRHMIELVAERLVLVDDGRAQEFEGSVEDYTDFVLGRGSAGGSNASKADRKADKRAAAQARAEAQQLRNRAKTLEKELADLTAKRSAIDAALFDPKTAAPDLAKLTMTDLMLRRAELEKRIDAAEAAWLEAS